LHAKLRNRTCQGLDRKGQGQGLTSLDVSTESFQSCGTTFICTVNGGSHIWLGQHHQHSWCALIRIIRPRRQI